MGAGFSVSIRRVSIVCFFEGAHRLLHDEHAPLRWRRAGGTRGGAASGAPPLCERRPVGGTHCLGGARRPIGALRTVWRRQWPAAECGQGGRGGAWGGETLPRADVTSGLPSTLPRGKRSAVSAASRRRPCPQPPTVVAWRAKQPAVPCPVDYWRHWPRRRCRKVGPAAATARRARPRGRGAGGAPGVHRPRDWLRPQGGGGGRRSVPPAPVDAAVHGVGATLVRGERP